MPRIAPDLGAIEVPTLVIHGGLDAIVPLARGEAAAETIRGAALVVIDDAGHVPTMTRPHEIVSAIDGWAATLPA